MAVEAVEATVEATVVASCKAEGLLGQLSQVLHIGGVLSIAVRGHAVNARTLRPRGMYMAAAELTSATATTGNFIMVEVGGRIEDKEGGVRRKE